MKDIPMYDQFIKIEQIHKGWSKDKKYYVETKDDKKLLLRISDISEYDTKKYEFELLSQFSKTGINMSRPIAFGTCNSEKEVLPTLSKEKKYAYGWEAGQMMLKMQTAENYPASSEWAKKYGKQVEKYIKNYEQCGYQLFGEEKFISFLEKNSSCLDNRPMSLLHADFQSDNMVISPDNKLYAIDFQGSGLVDPYLALGGVMVTAEVSPLFSSGQLHSYFGGDVPADFWQMNAYYLVSEMINAFSVAVTMGQEEIEYSQEMAKITLEWFDNFNHLVPNWYIEDINC
ncbi:aminoglycoside phosphotransferase family protein [Streptococcus merionis]|uniref:aminoglycoside phosphotransferase family protein n=1 Tax=Streptococcus merionis TaxID=400065 RepID=UPI0035126DAC